MADPGQTAYEARFTDEDRRRRYAHEWARLGPLEREMWARVEAASAAALARSIDGEDRIAAALRTINVGILQIKAEATERVEKAEARLRTVLERERETQARHDAALDALEAKLAEATEIVGQMLFNFDDLDVRRRAYAIAGSDGRDLKHEGFDA